MGYCNFGSWFMNRWSLEQDQLAIIFPEVFNQELA